MDREEEAIVNDLLQRYLCSRGFFKPLLNLPLGTSTPMGLGSSERTMRIWDAVGIMYLYT